MEFPRVGLIRNLADGAVLATWSYPAAIRDPAVPTTGEMIRGDSPYPNFDPILHEMVDLTIYTDEEYVKITEAHHQTLMEKKGREDQAPEFVRVDKDGKRTPHVVRGKVKPPRVEPPQEPVEPKGDLQPPKP